MLKNKKSLSLIAASISFVLAACGGGGGSTTTTTTTTITPVAFPLNTFYTNFFTAAHAFTLTGTSNNTKGNVVTLDYTLTPGGNSVFEGQAANTATETAQWTADGVVAPKSTNTIYFNVAPYKDTGYIGDGYKVYANSVALPNTSTIGDFGTFSTAAIYTDNTKKTKSSNAAMNWTLEAGPTATTAYFCTTEVTTSTTTADTTTTKQCYQTDSNGTFGGKRTYSLNATISGMPIIVTLSN